MLIIDTGKIAKRLQSVMDAHAAEVLAEVFAETIQHAFEQDITRRLDAIQRELAEQRTQTDQRFAVVLEELRLQRQHTEEQISLVRGEVAELRRHTDAQLEALRQQTEAQIQAVREEIAELRRHTDAQFRDLREQLGGLGITVGYALEDLAYNYLPDLLRQDYGIELTEGLIRTFVRDAQGNYLEVNIWGAARRNGQTLQIVGEAKSQLSKRAIDNFLRARVQRLSRVYPNLFPVMVAYMISEPDVFEYAQQKGVALYMSYQFQPRRHPFLPST